ncbi:hypothetical protein NQ854_01485 [Rhodococcus ruber]|uniref:hypothetical protein n=1 Tax=Rhodococcus TaxID=1827 RepID=UPI000AAD8058|nr:MULTISPECIES: hypothetical protein [Rhodococcus]MDO2381599.1 hypothetical protein [Rhodococcus ruber]MBP2214589.1 hypothetical protein [Rhodococcus ruber]UIR36427.1 hypothetical protein LZP97_22950 [Rhodococcus sp. DMF-1]WKK11424.1 hypothetical protein QYN14_22485 [Rhodococcus ruber]WML63266.1 hypothetical protein QNA09_26260 [Rhodococcus sp. AH-ZY2]
MSTSSVSVLRPTAKDRRDLWASMAVFAGTAAVVVADYVATLSGQLSAATVTARMELGEAATPVPTPSGVQASLDGAVTTSLPVAELSPVTVALLRTGDAAQTLSYLAVLGLLALLVRRFVQGRMFDHGTYRLTYHLGWVALTIALVPMFPRITGTNMAIRDLGLTHVPGVEGSWLGAEFWLVYAGAMVLSAVAIAIRVGNRMARDQEGLV